jgi:hypothetical protein
MKSTNWKDVAELIGITAIVASLLFVGLQMRQEQEIAIADTYASTTESSGTLAILIESNSEIWRDGLDGAELTLSEELKFLAMVNAVETHYFNMFLRFRLLEINDPGVQSRDYAYAIYTHPGLRRAYLKKKEFNDAQGQAWNIPAANGPFRRNVDSYLDQLDKNSPAIQSSKDYIFW